MTLGLLLISFLFIGLIYMLKKNFLNILMGIMLVGNAANLIIFYLTNPKINAFPFVRSMQDQTDKMADPLPQALILTAIVISFALFCLVAAIFKKALQEYDIKGDEDICDEGFEEVFK